MMWAPAARVDVDSVAMPPLSVLVPSVLVPSKNDTLPVDKDGETAALKVTDWPGLDGLVLEVSAVVVWVVQEQSGSPILTRYGK
jgi:hypothetical protein